MVELGLGEESASYYTCDLSHEYVSISKSLFSRGTWAMSCRTRGADAASLRFADADYRS